MKEAKHFLFFFMQKKITNLKPGITLPSCRLLYYHYYYYYYYLLTVLVSNIYTTF